MPEDMKIDVERVSMDDHEQTIQSKRFFPLAVGAFLLRNVVWTGLPPVCLVRLSVGWGYPLNFLVQWGALGSLNSLSGDRPGFEL